jgi:erythronate-4-phosphate dehydrogenase
MLIIADNNIPFAPEAFGQLGEVRLVQGRGLTADQVAGADVLLLRSTVKINEELLSECSPKFVGTATIGTDHVDTEYLTSRGITFANAPGSNADSVAEYWSSAVLTFAARRGWELPGRTVGVVGVGNVGRRVVRRARALGMQVLKCDPPLARKSGSDEYRSLEELLGVSDIITLHVPLNREGQDASLHMADGEFFAKLKPDALFVNTARGAVHDTAALLAALDSGRLAGAVLDVWEGEPVVECNLLERVDVGTPHIAGHSLDGKANGTHMLYREACRRLGAREGWKPADSLPPPEIPRLELDASAFDAQLTATEAALALYPIADDDLRLREVLTMPQEQRGAHFTALRVDYPVRRGFHNTKVVLSTGSIEQRQALAGLGFQVI